MADLHSPIEVPAVQIGDRLLVVKYDLYAEYCLSKAGISTKAAIAQMALKDVHSLAIMMDVWTACVAGNYRKSKETPPTADEWAMAIPDDKWRDCCQAIQQALVKVLRPEIPAQAPAAPAEALQPVQ